MQQICVQVHIFIGEFNFASFVKVTFRMINLNQETIDFKLEIFNIPWLSALIKLAIFGKDILHVNVEQVAVDF